MNHTCAKEAIIKQLVEKGIQFEDPSETEAIVTHWLQNQNSQIPFINDQLSKLFEREVCSPENNIVNEVEQFQIELDWEVPFKPPFEQKFKFIDLFAGIGGFRIAMQKQGGKCVFSSEWDEKAKRTYEANFGEVPFGDITRISENDIPDHDILCAGFPCQPFSLAGVSARNHLNLEHGFNDEIQGTLFFDIARIIEAKKPEIVFLENVRNLVSHDKGRTFKLIKKTFEELNYSFSFKIIDSSPLVAQRRVRCYMVAVREKRRVFRFPEIEGDPLPLKSILESNVDDKYTISDKLWEGHKNRTKRNLKRGVGFTAFTADLDLPSNTIVARYGKDGKECLIPQDGENPRMLTPRECARLQGFPEDFQIVVAKTNAYKQFGNSVAVPVVEKISEEIVNQLLE